MEFEAISIVGVVADEVGEPSNDGTAGSALYPVPIQLSRALSSDEARVLEQLWDHPPQFTTMHRPGVASVSGDRFVLTRTTVDEVARYHAATLRTVVDQFNLDMAEFMRRREAERAAQEAANDAHRQHVDEVASEIRFD